MATRERYWFPVKRYGWGWGLPTTWQGWVVLTTYIALIGFGALVWPRASDTAGFVLWTTFLTVLLVAGCWWKGEPPGWHWGS
jgi:hypothetical protein